MEQDNIEEIRKKAETAESQYIKLKQEFKDYIETSRKNEESKRQEMRKDFAKRLLTVADSLSRVSGTYDDAACNIVKDYSENLRKNIDMVYNQLLSASDLTPIDPAAGERFDEQVHTAIGLEYSITYPENSVFRVVRKGYSSDNTVIRPAEVIISKHLEEAKIARPGLWERLLRWINPAKFQLADVNQKIDGLERLRKEDIQKLAQEIISLRTTIIELEEKLEEKTDREVEDAG